MLPLLVPLAIQILPEIGKWLFGSTAASTLQQVGSVVSAVTGINDPHSPAGLAAVEAALQGNPELAGQIQAKLAEIAATNDAAQRKADLEELSVRLADTANSRSYNLALVQTNSKLAWEAAFIDGFVLLLFGFCVVMLLTYQIPDAGAARDIVFTLIGTVTSLSVTIVQFHRGSSAGSLRKSSTIEQSILPTSLSK